MPDKSRHQFVNEQLIVTSPDSDQMFVHDFSEVQQAEEQVIATPIVERALHLQNTLRMFEAAQQQRRIASARPGSAIYNDLARRYRARQPEVMQRSKIAAEETFQAARHEFGRAFGSIALSGIEPGEYPVDTSEESLQAAQEKSFLHFWKHFGLTRHAPERENLRRSLARHAQMVEDHVTEQHRATGERPHSLEAKMSDKTIGEERKLNTQERLQAIYEDPRAGFLPTTNEEKNSVLAYLDYLDNPNYPLGIGNQFLEVARSHLKRLGSKAGQQQAEAAALSLTYELGDFQDNAKLQLIALRSLEKLLYETPKPSLSLREAIEDAGMDRHEGVRALVRFHDLDELRRTGDVKGLRYKPLRTLRNELIQDFPRKNKRLEDRYTTENLHFAYKKRMNKFTEMMQVHEARELTSRAITDQEKRAAFMLKLLESLSSTSPQTSTLRTSQAAAQLVLQRQAS